MASIRASLDIEYFFSVEGIFIVLKQNTGPAPIINTSYGLSLHNESSIIGTHSSEIGVLWSGRMFPTMQYIQILDIKP